jgi:hypothetical protein
MEKETAMNNKAKNKQQCRNCDGTGTCPDCEGRGYHLVLGKRSGDCRECKKSGRCRECSGTGETK